MKTYLYLLTSALCFAALAADAAITATNLPAQSSVSTPGNASTNAAVGQPRMMIVILKKGMDKDIVISEHGLAPKFRWKHLNGFAARMTDAVAEKLKKDSRVMFVEPDGPVKLCGQTNGAGLVRIAFDRFPPARINGKTEPLDVDVAVFDSGIDPHPDLPTPVGWYSPFSDNPNDDVGHGTLVTGIIAALDNAFGTVGVASGCRIWNVKCLGQPPENSWTNVAGAIDWLLSAIGDRVSVANFSITNKGSGGPINTIHYFIQQMVNAGIVVVAAVGNNADDLAGPDGVFGTSDDYYPASFPEVMAVSAMIPRLQGYTDTFWYDSPGIGSNFGEIERTNGDPYGTNFVVSPGGTIDVAAPGVNIFTTLNGGSGRYAYVTGTSSAAPFVTGLVADYIAIHGRATNAAGVYAIRQAIINAALPQSQWMPRGYPYDAVTNNTGDPDSHPEPLAMASEELVPKPQIASFAGAPGNSQVGFTTVPGYDYTVQSTTNLASPASWTEVATVAAISNATPFSVSETNLSGQRFYRLARQSQDGPVVIVGQPQNAGAPVGASATFQVTVLKPTPYPGYEINTFGFQWRKDGSDTGNISGSTSNLLNLTNVQFADTGDYSVVITNNYGSVTSAVATLTILTNATTALVTGVVATATSELTWQTAANTVNGAANPGAVWASDGADMNPVITFDFGSIRPLEQMEIWNGPQSNIAVSNMITQVSSDGVNFHTVAEPTLTTVSPASETIALGGVQCRYVQFVILSNASAQYPGQVELDEVQFTEYREE